MTLHSTLKASLIVRITLVAALVLTIVACGGRDAIGVASDSSGQSGQYGLPAPSDLTEAALAGADSILASMSIEERVGQCFMPTILSSGDVVGMARLDNYIDSLHVGGIVLLKGNLSGAASMSARATRAKLPLFTAIDAEWGLGMRLEDAPYFPRNGRLSPDADEMLLFDYGRELARECRRIGINMVLGPVVDVVENPRGVIGSRSFGPDPVRVADLGVAYARGLESGGVISVAKHFPGHGSPVADSHKRLPVIGRTLHQLDSVDLYPFRVYIGQSLTGIMVGHLAVPAIDPDALPAAVSPVVIRNLLRDELGFKGLVITDALNMGGAEGHSAVEALRAGADLVIGPADTAGEIQEVLSALRNGTLSGDDIDDRCRRILFYKLLLLAKDEDMAALEVTDLRHDLETGAASMRRRLSPSHNPSQSR